MDIIRKLQYVSGENLTNTPSSTTYASVVSQDSEKNYFIFAALNDLDILAWYIQNTHLNEETKDECFFYAGDEWKSHQGRVVVVVRDVYGLK